MRLQTRVLLAQLPALIVLVLLLFLAHNTLERLGGEGHAVLGRNYRSVVAAQRMNESIERMDSGALFCLAGECARGRALIEEHHPRFEAELRVEEGNITEPGEAEAVSELRADWSTYGRAGEAFLEATPEERSALYFEQMLPAFSEVKAGCDRVLSLNQDAMVARADASQVLAERAKRGWLIGALLGLSMAAALGVALAGRIASPLRLLAERARQVGEAMSAEPLPPSEVLELSVLANAWNQMAERLRQYRRAADSDLARAREAAQAAIESLVDPVLVLDLAGEVRAANQAARRALGVEPGARRLGEGDPSLLEAVATAHAAVLADGRPVLPVDFSSVLLVGSEPEERAFLAHATPINDAVTGELVGVTVLLQDVTRLRHLDALKGDLVHTVAHELRTPLTSLGMALHLSLDERVSGPLPPRLLELLDAAREDVRRLRALVEDLLDLSRIQAGRIAPLTVPVLPGELLREVAEGARAAAEARGVHLEVDTVGEISPRELDPQRMRVALGNLVHNALRHSLPGGRVWLRARAAAEGLRLEVEDRGPGVADEEAARIFEPFVRGAAAVGEGAGLGLHIAREIARAHGGQIGVERPEEGGARFWIELPGA